MGRSVRSTTDAFARVRMATPTADAAWSQTDSVGVLCKHVLHIGTQANYVLCDRPGHLLAAIMAQRASIDAIAPQDQGRHFAEQPNVPFVVLLRGEGVRVLDRETGVRARKFAGFRSEPHKWP